MKISDIIIGTRHRQDLGDIAGLAANIAGQGLLQPIGVTPNNELVFGYRRLVAARDHLGWTEIDHRVVNVADIVSGEYAENMLRKDFTMSERIAILRSIETIGPGGPRGAALSTHSAALPSKEEAIKLVGFGSTGTVWRAEQLVDNAPDLAAQVDSGKISLSGAFKLADREGRVKRVAGEKKVLHRPTKPPREKRIDPPLMSLGTLPSGDEIGRPPPGAPFSEISHWRDHVVKAKVVLHPLRITQLLQDKQLVEQMVHALTILAQSPTIEQFEAAAERMARHRRIPDAEEPGDRIDFSRKLRETQRDIDEELDAAIAKLEGYRARLREGRRAAS